MLTILKTRFIWSNSLINWMQNATELFNCFSFNDFTRLNRRCIGSMNTQPIRPFDLHDWIQIGCSLLHLFGPDSCRWHWWLTQCQCLDPNQEKLLQYPPSKKKNLINELIFNELINFWKFNVKIFKYYKTMLYNILILCFQKHHMVT